MVDVLSFVYICVVVGDGINKNGGFWDTTDWFCACPKLGPDFSTPYIMVFFMFNGLRLLLWFCCGIIDHHCLNILFVILELIVFNYNVKGYQFSIKLYLTYNSEGVSGFLIPYPVMIIL